jgi:hypothetical protein
LTRRFRLSTSRYTLLSPPVILTAMSLGPLLLLRYTHIRVAFRSSRPRSLESCQSIQGCFRSMLINELPGALFLLLLEPWRWPSRLRLSLACAGLPVPGALTTAPVKRKRAYMPRKKPAAAAPTTSQAAPTAPRQRKRKAKANPPPPEIGFVISAYVELC